MENGFLAGTCHFKDRSQTGSTAVPSGAVKIAPCVPNHTGIGMGSVCSSGETVQHGFISQCIQLEHRPALASEIATIHCGAVEVHLRVAEQIPLRILPVRSSGEIVQHGFISRCIYFEDCPTARLVDEITAIERGAV